MKKFTIFAVLLLVFALIAVNNSFAAGLRDGGKGNLWILAVGIDEYPQNQNLHTLQYAVSDAENISKVFKAQEGKAFENVYTLLITDKETIKPTKENILTNMSFFQNTKPNDTVILFFALHSIIQDNIYYIMPSDSRRDAMEFNLAESMLDFNDILKSFDIPGKKIIILDTHYSQTATNLSQGKNITVLGASKDFQPALESSTFGGGLFTMSIVEAFRENAAKEYKITLGSLFEYVNERVSRISNGRQSPVMYAPAGMENMVLGGE